MDLFGNASSPLATWAPKSGGLVVELHYLPQRQSLADTGTSYTLP